MERGRGEVERGRWVGEGEVAGREGEMQRVLTKWLKVYMFCSSGDDSEPAAKRRRSEDLPGKGTKCYVSSCQLVSCGSLRPLRGGSG